MFPKFDHNASYIFAIYGLGVLALASMTVVVVFKARAARKQLERMEQLDKS